MLRRSLSLSAPLENANADEETLGNLRELQADLAALLSAERGPEDKVALPEYLFNLLKTTLRQQKIRTGTIAEIGGSKNSFMQKLGKYDVKFLSIFPSEDPKYLVADICNCPHIPDESFDVVFSTSVLEHVRQVHDAAREITRILKPGGITLHAVPFSYFFHGAPEDYWRLTTTALETLFEELVTIDSFFFADNRRRNNLGSPANRVDADGGPKFAPDALGGWRENWFSIYIGKKMPDGAERLHEKRLKQALVDIIKGLVERQLPEPDAIARAHQLAGHISFNEYGRLVLSAAPQPREMFGIDEPTLKEIWAKRSKATVRPSTGRPNLMAMLTHAGLV
jgi:SAM-dependent methyltransferase